MCEIFNRKTFYNILGYKINYLFEFYYKIASNSSRIALINPSLDNTTGFSIVVIRARSFVILPFSIVVRHACSNLSANTSYSLFPSNSPRFHNAPLHAKIVATEFVDVSSPFKCL